MTAGPALCAGLAAAPVPALLTGGFVFYEKKRYL